MLNVTIPVPDQLALKTIRATLKKMHIAHTEVIKKDKTIVLEVYVKEPIELYYLGANVVAETAGLFKSGLTQ